MPWGVAAAAAIGAAGTIASSRSASRAQQGSADAASQAQMDMYNQSRDDQAGYRARGDAAGNRLARLLGLNVDPVQLQNEQTFDGKAYLAANPDVAASPYATNPYQHWLDFGRNENRANPFIGGAAQTSQQQPQSADFGSLMRNFTGANLENEPGYQFRLSEGNRALDRSAASRGGLYSGAQLRGLTRYNQDFASNEYTNAFNRDQTNRSNQFNWLSGLGGTGQTATNQVGQQGVYTGAQIGQNLTGSGNARASGYLATGNALQNGLNQGISLWNRQGTSGASAGGGYNNWLTSLNGNGSYGLDQTYG